MRVNDNPPRTLIELTNECNLRCTYCHSNSGQARPSELDRDEALGIVCEIRRQMGKGAEVTFSGGEPLLVPWALDVVERSLELGLRPTVLSNGTLLTEHCQRLTRLLFAGARLRVSLAGTNRASCDAVSGADRFDRALNGIRALAIAGSSIGVDILLFPSSIEQSVLDAPVLAAQLPAEFQVALHGCHVGGRATETDCFETRADQEDAMRRILTAVGAPSTKLAALAPRVREGCDCALGLHLAIRSDASVYSCHRMQEAPIGNLRSQNLEYFLQTRFERARPVEVLAGCATCDISQLCGAGCRVDNLLYTGDPEHPPCGPWRKQLLIALVHEGHADAPDWDLNHLISEARRRGLQAPSVNIARHRAQARVRSLPITVAAGALAAACLGGPPHPQAKGNTGSAPGACASCSAQNSPATTPSNPASTAAPGRPAKSARDTPTSSSVTPRPGDPSAAASAGNLRHRPNWTHVVHDFGF